MFNKFSIFVTLALALAVTANVIPRAVKDQESFPIKYEGNDLFIGERDPLDYQLTQFGVWADAVEDTVVTKTLEIFAHYELTYIHAYDRAANQSSGSVPTLVSGGPGGKTATILFTSAPGKEIFSLVDVFGKR